MSPYLESTFSVMSCRTLRCLAIAHLRHRLLMARHEQVPMAPKYQLGVADAEVEGAGKILS